VFLGSLTSPSLHEQLCLADILVLPSRSEGLPVIVLEALSAQKLIVTTPVGSLPEFLSDGRDCVYISEATVEAVRQSLVHAVKLLKTGQSVEMVANGRKVWEKYFNCKRTTNELLAIWMNSIRRY
jgi:glycosyltransferase involved in cell wall biosynthesis